jgi:hypothetical protein
MIQIKFDPSRLEGEQKAWWTRWERRASRATRKAIEAWEESKDKSDISFNTQIWTDLKNWLLENYYNGKCAYCETRNPRFPLDAEHYRPKGGVDQRKEGTGAFIPQMAEDEAGEQIDHPGYFWLAYHWKNLVPSCKHCNSGHGKQNQFPVGQRTILVRRLEPEDLARLKEKTPFESSKWDKFYYLQPDDLDALEEPLLLHPYRDKPEEHLAFEHGGVVLGTSPEGQHTISVCNLQEDELRQDRQKAQEDAANKFGISYLGELQKAPDSPKMAYRKAWQQLPDIESGVAQYSAAARTHVKSAFPEPS